MKAAELRRAFLEFFARRGHRVMRSDPLVPPSEDKSLLFTGAGMNKYKNEFMGRGEPGLTRAATSQKCLRTSDVENVGRTPYHHTFFEMLGNFSFDDYFKRESIRWAWEFLTEVLKIPAEKLQASVYEDDDEAYAIWENDIGLAPAIIHRFGQHDNFWPADAPRDGPNGLCGPCSEIFYDWGLDVGCTRAECNPACDCGRFCEVWNLVFQQFERKDGGVLEPLPTKNIDTGMGLERLAAVMQGKVSNFDTDLFVPILEAIEREADTDYEPARQTREGVAFRRIADHVRAGAFCLADGILAANTGRGYVLRKLLRRAVLDGRRLGLRKPFLYRLVPVVAGLMGDHYPELLDRRENISRLIRIEEERFLHTLDQGLGILQEMMAALRAKGGHTLPGAEAFRLFDTYGFPLDVTESILDDEGLALDRESFDTEMQRQRAQSRRSTALEEDIFAGGPVAELKSRGAATEFAGYEQDTTAAGVVGLISGEQLVNQLAEGADGVVVLDRTAFYGESGGEVGDTGVVRGEDSIFDVSDTQRSEGLFLHVGKVSKGTVRVGDAVTAAPDLARRAAVRRSHTATHLLHHALREVLGPHAEQSGSSVEPDRLRFDFTHMQAVTPRELRLVEELVNRRILENVPVSWRFVGLDEARAQGAMALFGEKYGEVVRLLDIGGYSRELCGGLHCSATGDIGLCKITSESSVAAGIRRLEAVTGMEALSLVHDQEDLLRSVCAALGAPEAQLAERASQLSRQLKELRKDVQRARRSQGPGAEDYLGNAREVAGAKIVAARDDAASPDDLRDLSDRLRRSGGPVAVALGSAQGGRVVLVVAFTKDLVARGCHAGKIAGAAARLCGGGGGGRPDMAQAGGKNPAGLDDALAKASELIAATLAGG